MIEIKIPDINVSPQQAAADFAEAANRARPGGQLEAMFLQAILQLHRYAVNDIEVDTGRTKNSLFTTVASTSNSVVATLAAQTNYAPYVRDRAHAMPFMESVIDHELPKVLETLPGTVVEYIDEAFG